MGMAVIKKERVFSLGLWRDGNGARAWGVCGRQQAETEQKWAREMPESREESSGAGGEGVVGGFRKGTMASAQSDTRHFSSSLYATGAFKLLPQCWSSEGVSLSGWIRVWGFFKRNCLGLHQFVSPAQSLLGFAARSCGDLFSWHWNPGLGHLVWGRHSSVPRYPSWIFIHHTWRRNQPVPVCSPPTSMDGCGFFNSLVVRLPFNLISEGSEWWLFYILILIWMKFYKEVSHVCLHHHCDWKPYTSNFYLLKK